MRKMVLAEIPELKSYSLLWQFYLKGRKLNSELLLYDRVFYVICMIFTDLSLVLIQQKSYIFGLLGIFLSLMFFSCKTAKLSDAEEKHRIGEYYEAAAIYRKVYTKTSPKKRDLRGYIAFRMAECNRMINSTDKAICGYMNALRYEYPDSILN